MSLIKRKPSLISNIEPIFSDPFFSRGLRGDYWPGARLFFDEDSQMLSPRIDIVDQDNEYLVTADLPGVKKGDIEVSLDQGVLTISAKAEEEKKEEEKGKVIRHERFAGQYMRRLDLGSNVSEQGIKASFKEGVLSIIIPKIETQKHESLKVDVK